MENGEKNLNSFVIYPPHYPFKEYKKTAYEGVIPIDEGFKLNWETVSESLKGTEWEQLVASETWEKVLPLTLRTTSTTSVEYVVFKSDIYQPEILKETSIDFAKHLYLDKIDIGPEKRKTTKIMDDEDVDVYKYYDEKLGQNRWYTYGTTNKPIDKWYRGTYPALRIQVPGRTGIVSHAGMLQRNRRMSNNVAG